MALGSAAEWGGARGGLGRGCPRQRWLCARTAIASALQATHTGCVRGTAHIHHDSGPRKRPAASCQGRAPAGCICSGRAQVHAHVPRPGLPGAGHGAGPCGAVQGRPARRRGGIGGALDEYWEAPGRELGGAFAAPARARERTAAAASWWTPSLDRSALDAWARFPQEELRHPAAAQVALVTHALAAAAVLREEGGIDAASAQGTLVNSVLGHSVGEISACAAAGALSLPDAVRLAVSTSARPLSARPRSCACVRQTVCVCTCVCGAARPPCRRRGGCCRCHCGRLASLNRPAPLHSTQQSSPRAPSRQLSQASM